MAQVPSVKMAPQVGSSNIPQTFHIFAVKEIEIWKMAIVSAKLVIFAVLLDYSNKK